MKKSFVLKNAAVLLAIIATMLLTACASTTPQTPAEPEPQVIAIEPWDGNGLDIPLDGSSMEAFETSKARVKAHTTPAEYQSLESAIAYLLVYDIAAKGQMELLVPRLDGFTTRQLRERIKWRRSSRDKNEVEKDKTDIESIDT